MKKRCCYSVLELQHQCLQSLLWKIKINNKRINVFAHYANVMQRLKIISIFLREGQTIFEQLPEFDTAIKFKSDLPCTLIG